MKLLGTIVVSFTLPAADLYLVHISLRKKPICFSPYCLTALGGLYLGRYLLFLPDSRSLLRLAGEQ
jgi:hypothetical protein